MADSKKYNGSTWQHSLHKLGTATDTLTTLPADLYADGNSATVALQGNMQQTGTPTPQNPIQPQECGELETTGAHAGQYKTPILSADQTTPVYLGEVETERKIVKYEFTGNEAWDRQTPEHSTVINLYCPIQNAMPKSPIYCNIAEYDARAGSSNDAVVNIGKINSAGTNLLLDMVLADYNTTGVWKKYLQQQYAAGTPVTVWYVLSEPTTGIVNEPLRKIGTYADGVANVSIPVTAGGDTISVDTQVQPSEVSVNFKGWHPVQSVHERESGAWT